MLDWLIIGGGIHGTHLSFVLTKRYGVSYDRVRVLDPHAAPLALWDAATANVGMGYPRSPIVHHLHYDQGSMGVFGRIHQNAPYTRFIPPHNRPSLELFSQHSRYLIERYKLASMREQGRSENLVRLRDGWRVETANGSLETRKIILAIGMSEQPYWPDWARELGQRSAPIHHIFEAGFSRAELPVWDHIVVIGGGITAAQTALSLARQNQQDENAKSKAESGAVTLLMRHAPRQFDFDSDPGWMNPIYLRDYAKIADFDQRRQVIRQARHRGSMPPDVARDLQIAIEHGQINLSRDEIVSVSYADERFSLHLGDGQRIEADHVVLATGYEQQRPGGKWLDDTIGFYALPVAACGYPVVDETLCWSEGLYVSGPLAELEIGPPSRNIIGARLAGQRLAGS